MKKTINNLAELETFAEELLRGLPEREGATLITLSGDLGAGKTTLTQMIAKELGITETITSPTFVIMKEYEVADPLRLRHLPLEKGEEEVVSPPAKGEIKRGWSKLTHIDAYRLESGQELLALGFAEALAQQGNLIILEWPEMVSDIDLSGAVAVTLRIGEGEVREVEVL